MVRNIGCSFKPVQAIQKGRRSRRGFGSARDGGVFLSTCARWSPRHTVLYHILILELGQARQLVGFMSLFSVSELLASTVLVRIIDQLASPGDFLLHQLLSEYVNIVKSSPDGKCIIISASQDLIRWKTI